MLSGEATNNNFIVLGLTRPWLKSLIFHTRGEGANHYTTDAVNIWNLGAFYSPSVYVAKRVKWRWICLFPSRGFGCNGDYANKIDILMLEQMSVKTWTIKRDLYINAAPSIYYENKIDLCFLIVESLPRWEL